MIVGGKLYNLAGALTPKPAAHGLTLVSVPCRDGLSEVCFEASTSNSPTAIGVLVHSFSGDHTEITVDPAKSALLGMTNMAWICPELFGIAGNPNTCGAPAQLAHLNDVIAWMRRRYGNLPVFFSGVSGGAGLGPTFIGAYPGMVQGMSAWCGYYRLSEWYAFSVANNLGYDGPMRAAFGGPPTGALAAVYDAQSPFGTLPNATDCAIVINSGRLDTSIPIAQSDEMQAALALRGSFGVNSTEIDYPSMGHAVMYPVVVSQINAMRAAL